VPPNTVSFKSMQPYKNKSGIWSVKDLEANFHVSMLCPRPFVGGYGVCVKFTFNYSSITLSMHELVFILIFMTPQVLLGQINDVRKLRYQEI